MNEFQQGRWLKQSGYQSFQPSVINREWVITSPKILTAMSRADRQIGRLDMFSQYAPDRNLFVQMHVTKEATESSRIEDTQTQIDEAILPEEEIALERRDDWREVQNYIEAMRTARERLKSVPFSVRLLKEAHATLLSGVRGERKMPGDFRVSQNWIGGSNPGNARFVPPHHDDVPELMLDLELFAHNESVHVPPLIRAGILHYQFEAIHPFLDGNGRIGRLMIPLYLISVGILEAPVLYLSDYFERNRQEYYERLTRVREHGELSEWLHFFLDGVAETASLGVETFDRILKFKAETEADIRQWKRHSAAGALLFERLFGLPWVNAQQVAEVAEVSQPTAYKVIQAFQEKGLLKEITGAQRGRIYTFEPYLKLFRRKD